MQNTSQLLMIRPIMFGYNSETAVNNAFQQAGHQHNSQEKALIEFDNFTKKLSNYEVDLLIIQDTKEPLTPDSIFPNNWISFHEDGKICLFPMFAKNRRAERNSRILEEINSKFIVSESIDFTHWEKNEKFLEGTGSMVLDRVHKIAFACLSPRTDKDIFENFCEKLNYTPISFSSFDKNNNEIYHTNVMMSIAEQYAIVCLDSIRKTEEKQKIKDIFQKTNKEIIEISFEQMNQFAGNMLQIKNKNDEQFLVMSNTAFSSLTTEQIKKIKQYNEIINSELDTIEKNGGGSARCMLAEIFLKKK